MPEQTPEQEQELTQRLDRLRDEASGFPRRPGVYLMKDPAGEVIYVGKAVNLRARVKSYFLGGDGRRQIRFLLRRVAIIEKIVADNEHQALVLERDLIARYKPRYNIRLKDDKAFLSIRINENDQWPRLELVRKREEGDDDARYFGPYSYSYELREMLEMIKRVVPLRSCTNTVFYNRARPCLEYQIKRCAGPCCLEVDPEQYRRWVKQAIAILEGRIAPLLKELTEAEERAGAELRFEDAAQIRDRIAILERFKQGVSLVSSKGENRDIFAWQRDEQLAALTVMQMRGGRVVNSVNFSLTNVAISDEELLEAAILQFYDSGREIPEELVLPIDLENWEIIAAELQTRRGGRVSAEVPQRGLKHRLLQLAQVNASEHFIATFDAESRYRELAGKLAAKLELKQVPRRIECVDISNFQGSDVVGAIVCFFDGVPKKDSYRTFKIKTAAQGKPDDFASINEVVGRRLDRGREENDLPDLLIVDGGPGQLAMAVEAREALGVALEIVSLAKMRTLSDVTSEDLSKKPERVYREEVEQPLLLDEADEVTRFLQRIRDEAHRFVISFHRKRRKKRIMRSVLDDISGLGPQRKERLLSHFGSIQAIARAEEDEIARIGRMPGLLARKVKAALTTT